MQQLERKTLIINGVERYLTYEPEKDNLSVVLRRWGLTGTKIGCAIGVCGACSVILDGKVIRACTKKMKSVPEGASITTIEGLGTAENLHPLQMAYMYYGALQCGFCTPGFIVSAYELLQENPSPTREEVRAWFQKHHNVCRCTGYKQITDAVMAAAKVMRGEATMDEITYNFDQPIYGSSRPRPSALAKVTGQADYGDDIKLKMPSGVAHLALVLSKEVHANIISIDTSEADNMPGVIKVLTAKDVKGTNQLPNGDWHARSKGDNYTNVICDTKIKKRGEVVAVVAADSEEHARAAAKKVKQNLELLPAYMTAPEATAPDALDIFEGVPNMHIVQPVLKGEDTEPIFENADYVVEGSFYSQHEPHLPIEPDTMQAYWGADGMMTVQCKSQGVANTVYLMSSAIGLPMDKIRIILNPIGGSFGYSCFSATYAVAAAAVMALDMPVTLTLSYEEHMHVSGKRPAGYHNARLCCNKDGKLLATEFDTAVDHGAYGILAAVEMGSFCRFPYHGYAVPNVKGLGRAITTNHSQGIAYRGFGSTQAYCHSEALMDMLAEKVGIDPFELRYINLARPGDTTINCFPYREYPYVEIFDKARPIYEEYKAEAEKARAEGKLRGVGIGCGGFHVGFGIIDTCEVALGLNADGTFTHYSNWEDCGQGGDIGALTHAMKALEPLGVKDGQVKLVMGDTKTCPDTGMAAASRSHFMAGMATINAANQLMDAMRKPDGTYRTYQEMVAENIPTKYIGRHDMQNENIIEPNPNNGANDKSVTYMYCLNLAEVEVDPNTGKTKVLRFTAVADVGVLGNKLAVDGQAYGGIDHSIGYALSENYFDIDKHTNIIAAGIPQIEDIPDDFNIIYIENPRPRGPFGSSGCSENFQASNHMAVVNAIANATGARVYELPALPEKVKAAMEAKKRGEEIKPEKYFLGSDMLEELENCANNPV